MQHYNYFYLIRLEYLGFRFHGWQKQPQVKTLQGMLEKTLRFVFQHDRFKAMGSSRTDAKVSATDAAFELFLYEELPDGFMAYFNENLPQDIRAVSVDQVDAQFNILQSVASKTYQYFFAHGQKAHPYSAPYIATVPYQVDIELMKQGARLFLGNHNFKNYCTQPKPNSVFERNIESSAITRNERLKANFFPEETFMYEVKSKGFLRNQVRLMIGALLLLGKGGITLDELEHSLKEPFDFNDHVILAPASGLHLETISFT